MNYKEITFLNEQKGTLMKCVCVGYEAFVADCDDFILPRYRQFKCNPKHQFESKAKSVLSAAINERPFLPDLFYTRLNKKQSVCNSQIDYVFELLDRAFLEKDVLRQNELDKSMLEVCLSPKVDYVMIYVGMNR